MSNKVGKIIENCIRWGRWISSSVDIHGESVALKLSKRTNLDKQFWTTFLFGLRTELMDDTNHLLGTELKLARERAETPGFRGNRNDIVEDLIDTIESARALLKAMPGDKPHRFGLNGSIPRTPFRLEIFARNAIEALLEADESYVNLDQVVSTSALAAQLEVPHRALRNKLAKLEGEERRAEACLVKRDKAKAKFEQTYRAVAGMLEHAYELAGEQDLADRVKPTSRRSSGAESPEEADIDAEIPELEEGDIDFDSGEPVVDNDGTDEPVEA